MKVYPRNFKTLGAFNFEVRAGRWKIQYFHFNYDSVVPVDQLMYHPLVYFFIYIMLLVAKVISII